MNIDVLEGIGLTPGEIKVYIALLETGPSTAGNILKKANIQNSVFHFCINNLIEKGLASYITKGKRKQYHAAKPENLLAYVKDKEREIQKILPELKLKEKPNEEQEAEIYEGNKGIMNLFNELIMNAKPNDTYYFFATDVPEYTKEIETFFERYEAKRQEKRLIIKGLAKKGIARRIDLARYPRVRYVDFPIPTNISICNNKMAIITWGEKPTGILIKSRQIIEKQKEFFEALWKTAK